MTWKEDFKQDQQKSTHGTRNEDFLQVISRIEAVAHYYDKGIVPNFQVLLKFELPFPIIIATALPKVNLVNGS